VKVILFVCVLTRNFLTAIVTIYTDLVTVYTDLVSKVSKVSIEELDVPPYASDGS
jgi:hypothetical protein